MRRIFNSMVAAVAEVSEEGLPVGAGTAMVPLAPGAMVYDDPDVPLYSPKKTVPITIGSQVPASVPTVTTIDAALNQSVPVTILQPVVQQSTVSYVDPLVDTTSTTTPGKTDNVSPAKDLLQAVADTINTALQIKPAGESSNPVSGDNTMMYLGIGAIGIVLLMLFLRK